MASLEELKREAMQRGEALPDELAAISSGELEGDIVVEKKPKPKRYVMGQKSNE